MSRVACLISVLKLSGGTSCRMVLVRTHGLRLHIVVLAINYWAALNELISQRVGLKVVGLALACHTAFKNWNSVSL